MGIQDFIVKSKKGTTKIIFDHLVDLTDCEITIPCGVHRLNRPIRLTGKNIRIIGENGAVLRGTASLPNNLWKSEGDNVYSAPLLQKADGLYFGDRYYPLSRYPKFSNPDKIFGGYSGDCIKPCKTKDWKNPIGGYIHAMHKHLWGGYSYLIAGKNPDGSLILSGGWQNNRQMGMHEEYMFAENIKEEMTNDGECFYDVEEKRVYAKIREEDKNLTAEAVVNSCFFILEGCENVTLENLTLEASSRTFMETKEPLLRSDWTIYRGGAVVFRNCRDCSLDLFTMRNIGSNGVFIDGKNKNVTVSRSHFKNIGASGICFVGKPSSVRSPLFEYAQTQSIKDVDLTHGPKTDEYPSDCLIDNCLIEYVGTTEKQASGVQVSMAYGITIKDCTICHTSRSGINFSEGTFGGHKIVGCDVFDTVRETSDHGSFNSWGRDRYWRMTDANDEDYKKYALLDIIAPNVITRNRFRCDHGWDIDLDDGSSNYIITENLCLHGGIKLREGFYRTVKHNVMVDNSVHLHVWYPNSEDVVEENILFKTYCPIRMPKVWGASVKNNYLHTPFTNDVHVSEDLTSIYPQDTTSVCINACFVNAKEGNYTPTHPKLCSFSDFPTEFGVRYQPLREIADTPILPTPQSLEKGNEKSTRISIDGIIGKNIENDGEMSVYGTAEYNGVIVCKVERGTLAEIIGLKEGDVITEVDFKTVRNVAELEKIPSPFCRKITILRKQQKIVL